MNTFRKHINETFFNPILHLIPILVFIFVDSFYPLTIAWIVVLPISFILLFYVKLRYKEIYNWHLFVTFIFFLMAIVISYTPKSIFPPEIEVFADEIIILLLLTVLLILKKPIGKVAVKIMPPLIPMTNNLQEFYKIIKIFFFILLTTLSISLFLLTKIPPENKDNFLKLVQYIHLGVLLVFVIYELIHVYFVRKKMAAQIWWPIVDKTGKEIGIIESTMSLEDGKKYMHPVIRMIILSRDKLLLHKKSANDIIAPNKWDASISEHLIVNDNINERIGKALFERYGIKNRVKPTFIANYIHETETEKQYVSLYIFCISPDKTKPDADSKWWSLKFIEDNIEDNIFSENLLKEYNILKRGGIIESSECNCDCVLKNNYNKLKGS